jgi:hypothetical protein
MLLIIPIAVIFALSYAVFVLLRKNTLESVFISVSSIVIAMLALTPVAGLQLSAYIICGIIAAALSLAILTSVKNKRFFKDIIAFINNPALAAFVIAAGVYAYFIHDNHLYTWDDFSHWGLAVRALMVFDGIHITQGILEPQTIGMPMWNAFLISLSGMSDGYMLIGMWFVYWACLLLPVSNMKWDKVLMVIVYSILMYVLLMFASHQPRPNLYCDAMLSVISGSLISYYFINKNKSEKHFLIIILGCALLPHIKNATGMAFAALVLCFIAVDVHANRKTISKLNKRRLIYAVAAAAASGIYAYALKKIMRTGEFRDGQMWCNPMADIAKAVINPIGIAILILLAALGVLSAVLQAKKHKHTLKAIISFCAIFTGLILWTTLNLEGNTRLLITQFAKNLWRLDIYGLKANLILLTMVAAGVLLYYFGINKDSKNTYLRIGRLLIAEMLIYIMSIMFSYSKFTYGEGIKSADLYRYLLSFLTYIAIGGVGILICEEKMWKSKWTIYNYEKDMDYTITYNYKAEQYGKDISSALGMDDKVYVVTQGDSGHLANLLRNFSLPVFTSRENYSLGPPKSDIDGWSVELTASELSKYIIDRGYTYLFILEIDDYFISEYGDMFNDPLDIQARKLYKTIKTDDNSIQFMLDPQN